MSQMGLFDRAQGTAAAVCKRCGRPCQGAIGNPDARLLRRAMEGLCVDCAVTQFLVTTEPIATVLEIKGPSVLLDHAIREQFRRLMEAGFADAHPAEIDWRRVVANWELPMPGGRKERRGHGR